MLITGLALLLENRGFFVGTDINPDALAITERTLQANQISNSAVVRTSLASSLLPQTADVLLFNPPYVPTEDEEVGVPDLSAAWAGGERGRRVIDVFLPQLPVFFAHILLSGCFIMTLFYVSTHADLDQP